MELLGNKGEWSEVYAFLKLLSTGKLHAADADLNKIENVFYEIINIFRKEEAGELRFSFNKDSKNVAVVKQIDDTFLITLKSSEFEVEADFLLEKIQNGNDSSFTIQRIESFLKKLGCEKLKAPATDKSDIVIQIHDLNTGYEPVLAFSIKSRLGSSSTLLNAGKTTNFTYKINGSITDEIMNKFNVTLQETKKIREALSYLTNENCSISFDDMDNATFKNNLLLMDSDLPAISALMLMEYYINGNTSVKKALQ